jgi:hypothetical protein
MGVFTRLLFCIRKPRAASPVDQSIAEEAVPADVGGPDVEHHPARFAEATVYFVWTQATAMPINLGRAVQQLLDAEVATSAAWPSEERVRLAPSIAKLDRGVIKLRKIQSLIKSIEGISTLIRAAMRHPRVTTQMLVTSYKGRRTQGDSEARSPDAAAERPLEDTLAEIDGMLMDRQKVSIAERAIDAGLFGGEAQNEDHFVRLMLRSSRHEVDLIGTEHHLTIEPRLLLHKDGAMQLTIGMHLPAGVETSDLIAAAYPSLEYIVRSHIPEPYAGRRGTWVGGEWAAELDAGVRVRSLEHDGWASIYDYIGLVSDCVLKLIRARPYGEWNCYPIVMAQAGDCCSDWARIHYDDLMQVAARSEPKKASHFQYLLGPDFSVQSDHAFYLNSASAFIVYWRRWSSGIGDLNVTLLFEHTMLVYSRLRRLERDIRKFPTRRREVHTTYRTALQLALEARGATIRWASARAISRHLLAELGATEIRATIDQGLSMLGERASARTDERAARGANRLALIGVLIAFIASIPGLPIILSMIEEQRRTNPNATAWSAIQTVAASPVLLSAMALSAVLLYLLLNVTVVTVRVVRYLFGMRKRGYASSLAGYRISVGDSSKLSASTPATRSASH